MYMCAIAAYKLSLHDNDIKKTKGKDPSLYSFRGCGIMWNPTVDACNELMYLEIEKVMLDTISSFYLCKAC